MGRGYYWKYVRIHGYDEETVVDREMWKENIRIADPHLSEIKAKINKKCIFLISQTCLFSPVSAFCSDFRLCSQFRTAWKRFLNIPGVLSDTSLEGEVTTGVSKLMVGHQELAHSANSAIVEGDQPSGFICCMVQDEYRRQTAEAEKKFGCNLEMVSNKCQQNWTSSDVGDVSL